MPEAVVIALISATTAVITALLTYLAQRPQRKTLKEVKEQVVNDHEKSTFPNTRDELTSTRETVELLTSKVDTLTHETRHTRDMVGSVAERLALTDRNRKDIEDTLSSRDELTEDRLETAITRHSLDMEHVDEELRKINQKLDGHPASCAAFRPRER